MIELENFLAQLDNVDDDGELLDDFVLSATQVRLLFFTFHDHAIMFSYSNSIWSFS